MRRWTGPDGARNAITWQMLRPHKSFAVSLGEYGDLIQPCIEVRNEIASLRAQLKAALTRMG
jgi:hypothetical protein